MASVHAVTLQLPAAVTNGIALAQTPAAAGPLTLNGSLVTSGVANLVVPQRVGVAASGPSDSAVVFTITGTNGSGAQITDTVTGLSSNTVRSSSDFLTVTSVTASAATVGTITVGTVGVGSTPWVFDNMESAFWALSVAVVIQAGALNYTVEHTYDDPNAGQSPGTSGASNWSLEPLSNVPAVAWPHSVLFSQTKNGEGTYANQPIYAHRLTINSGTGRALLQSIQAGIGSSP